MTKKSLLIMDENYNLALLYIPFEFSFFTGSIGTEWHYT